MLLDYKRPDAQKIHELNQQVTDQAKKQIAQMRQLDAQIQKTILSNAGEAVRQLRQTKAEGNRGDLPFGMSPRTLRALLKLDASPEKLDMLQRALDKLFDQYTQSASVPTKAREDPTIEVR